VFDVGVLGGILEFAWVLRNATLQFWESDRSFLKCSDRMFNCHRKRLFNLLNQDRRSQPHVTDIQYRLLVV